MSTTRAVATTTKTLLAPGLARTTGPTIEPISLDQAKEHCRIASGETGHDAKLVDIISAAREQVENDTNQALITQTFTLSLDEFPGDGRIYVPMKPLIAVSAITYYDESNAQQTLSSSVYAVNKPLRLVYRDYDQSWPNHVIKPGGIVITFTAGYGTNPATVPAVLKRAMLLQISKWFEHTGDELAPHGATTYDQAYEKLIKRYLRSSYP